MIIRAAQPDELETILNIERMAFDSEQEAALVAMLLSDPSAEPTLSLLAFIDGEAAGHILFTTAAFDPPLEIEASILGPLAVAPLFQKRGVGGKLIQEGLRILADRGVDYVFVLGHESYYPRFGFQPALEQGFKPPYPIPLKFTNAWMGLPLTPTCIATYHGKVIPARTFDAPEYWGE